MAKYIYGVDLGGTTVKMGLFTVEGELLSKWEIPTRKEASGVNILPDIADSIRDNMKSHDITEADVEGIGIGVPGPVDNSGVIHGAANLGWGEFSVKETMERALNIRTVVGNDANVAALGEMWAGGAQGYSNVVMVTLGTGVGGGVIVDGKIVNGATGAGGEIGHLHVNDDEEDVCGCGNKGCLEQYSSATGCVRIAKKKLAELNQPSSLRDKDIAAKDIFDAMKLGDGIAIEVGKVYGEYLGRGLAMVSAVVNPEVFCIGGGVAKAGQIVIDYLKPSYDKYAFRGCRDVAFTLATLGNDAGIYGSAKLVIG